MDPNIPKDVKAAHMSDWWIGDFDIFTAPNVHLTERDFYQMVQSSYLSLRYGILEMMQISKANDLSLVVSSGGIKSII